MSLFKRLRKQRNARNPSIIIHPDEFLRESDSSIEKALFLSSNFLSVPSSGRSLLNIKSSQEKFIIEKLNKAQVRINVGGERFIIPYRNITSYPNTLLATREIEKYVDHRQREYFFDRDPDMFRYVYKFYKNDKIHYPMDECIQALIDEFKFFKIPLEIIKDCCYPEFYLEYENNSNCHRCAKQKRPSRYQAKTSKNISPKFLSLKNRARNLLNDPTSGRKAKALNNALLLCVFLNILGIIIETLPCNSGKCEEIYWKAFLTFDSVCVLIFTVEFLANLVVQKNRKAFFCCVENLVFFISLVPAYITWFLYLAIGVQKIPVHVDDSLKALRIIRLVKIAKSSSHLRETVMQIVAAARGLALVFAACIIAILVLSVLIYHLEGPPSFPNVPAATWYFVVTMTSLGYGDIVPSTTAGKVLGTVGVFLGILVVSLPVPIIQNKLGANLEEVEPETDEIVLDSLYPPDFADRQRRLSRMISLENRILNLKKLTEGSCDLYDKV